MVSKRKFDRPTRCYVLEDGRMVPYVPESLGVTWDEYRQAFVPDPNFDENTQPEQLDFSSETIYSESFDSDEEDGDYIPMEEASSMEIGDLISSTDLEVMQTVEDNPCVCVDTTCSPIKNRPSMCKHCFQKIVEF